MSIVLSKDLQLPVKLATETLLVVGKRGSGKTSSGVRLVEQLIAAEIPCAILDPADVWWGLKAPGRGRGLKVYVFGGRYADVPLEAHGGALLADVLVEQRISAVLSVRHLSGGERTRFVTDFAQRLIARNTERLHLVLEEAHELAPQNPQPGEQVMLGAIKKLWKLGRSSGLGGTAITQRPAALSKDITTQSEILVVHRLIGPQDVEAVRQWIKYHGQGETILGQLAGLKTGEAFVWSPEFPESAPIGLQRVQITPRDTFDSSATPDGEKAAAPKSLAPVDLDRLREKMAETIKRAEEADPKRLRARVATLERELAARPAAPPPATVEVDVLKPAAAKRLEELVGQFNRVADKVSAEVQLLTAVIARAAKPAAAPKTATPAPMRIQNLATGKHVTSSPASSKLASGERKILTALAQYPQGRTVVQVAILTGYASGGGGFKNYLSALRTRGLIEGTGDLRITAEGSAELGDFEPLPEGKELLKHWLGQLGKAERLILEAVAAGKSTIDDVAQAAGYEVGGGGFKNAVSRLRTLELVSGRGALELAEALRE